MRASAAVYILPEEENYVQPTVAADHGNWHLETRYNYEDRDAISGFLGWNFEFGSNVVLEVTPMLGAVVGTTDGVVPAVIADLTWKRLEFYIEGEYLIDGQDAANSFAYHWSEASVWITEQSAPAWSRSALASTRRRVTSSAASSSASRSAGSRARSMPSTRSTTTISWWRRLGSRFRG